MEMFNNRHYVADKINERNATPLAVARILIKDDNDESEDEDGDGEWTPVPGVVKTEPVSPIKVKIEPILAEDQAKQKIDKLLDFFTNKMRKSLSFETEEEQPRKKLKTVEMVDKNAEEAIDTNGLTYEKFTCSGCSRVLNKVEVITHKC